MTRSSLIFTVGLKRQSLLSRCLPPDLPFPLANPPLPVREDSVVKSQGLVPGKKARWLCYHGDSCPSAQHLGTSPASYNPALPQRLRGTKGRRTSSVIRSVLHDGASEFAQGLVPRGLWSPPGPLAGGEEESEGLPPRASGRLLTWGPQAPRGCSRDLDLCSPSQQPLLCCPSLVTSEHNVRRLWKD